MNRGRMIVRIQPGARLVARLRNHTRSSCFGWCQRTYSAAQCRRVAVPAQRSAARARTVSSEKPGRSPIRSRHSRSTRPSQSSSSSRTCTLWPRSSRPSITPSKSRSRPCSPMNANTIFSGDAASARGAAGAADPGDVGIEHRSYPVHPTSRRAVTLSSGSLIRRLVLERPAADEARKSHRRRWETDREEA